MAQGRRERYGIILAVYLLGLLVGGLYVGIISPVRTVIQEGMGIGDTLGIWMINIYTLFYAATIPISGKLADRYGRKRIFTACVGVFCAGAVMCGASQHHGGFALLIAGRVVQAAGAGGIIPVATAEMGTSFPEERRGVALGLAAAVSGIANVLGAAAGSWLLSLVGNTSWSMVFYLSIPVCALIIAASLIWLPNHTSEVSGRLDALGSVLLTVFVLLLLSGLRDLDFFNLGTTLLRPQCWMALVASVVVAVVFSRVEAQADDPIFHMEYFSNRRILITMAVSFFVGCCTISMVMIPQFAEAALRLQTGSGGYYVAIIGVFAVVGPPIGGAIIDRRGAKPVLVFGLAAACLGFVYLALCTASHPSVASMLVGLAVVGFGMGFTMGTPLNYMILQNTSEDESNSAIATLALVRQIGTSLAPAVLVGFIAASTGMAGYRNMLLAVAACNAISLVLMLFYHEQDG